MDPETRAYFETLRREMRELGDELRGEIHGVRDELRDEVHGGRDGLRGEIGAVEARMRRHLDVSVEAMRHDLGAIAEGVVANTEAIDRLRADVAHELEARFAASTAAVRAAFSTLKHDVDAIRARLR
ncbi:MAG: hypothetical protein HY294_16820 [Candidatus Rokubacteria bacterium]|nr:hypothetical protein [Candidatus Rokubacteria bacterium]MBI3827656.1 hypothetical protein [Candidatus Rokubacteria bacterium]